MTAVLVTLLSVPLFVNLQKFELFIRHVRKQFYWPGGMDGIPFPFFAFLLVIIFLLVCLANSGNILKKIRRIDIVFFALFAVFLFITFLSSYSIASIFQLLLFPVLLWLVSFFNLDIKLSKYFLFGAVFFAFFHLLSILYLNNWSLIKPFPRHLIYESIFNYQIYQALISYVNVLTLVAVAIVYFSIKENKIWRLISLACALILVLYVSALSSQRQYAVDLILISMFFISLCIFAKKIRRRNKLVVLSAMIIVWGLSIFLVHNSAGASAPKRLLNTILGINEMYSDALGTDLVYEGITERHDNAGMERVGHMSDTIYSIKDRVKNNKIGAIISGTGQVHSGSHNFILDLISGSGLLGALSYFLLLFGAFWKFIRPCFNKSTFYQLSFLILLFLMAGAGSMVNSPLTQPYYFLNLLFVAWFIASDIQTKKIYKN
jgi:hypothetical protein